MFECLILGDSIAVGTQQFKQECISISKGGYNSFQWNKEFINRPALDMQNYKSAIISLGSNDHSGVNTRKELEKIRASIKAEKVYWIMPSGNPNQNLINKIQDTILSIARSNGDQIIYIKGIQKDGIHPSTTGYKQIVSEIK